MKPLKEGLVKITRHDMALGSLYDEHSIDWKVNRVSALPPLSRHWLIPSPQDPHPPTKSMCIEDAQKFKWELPFVAP